MIEPKNVSAFSAVSPNRLFPYKRANKRIDRPKKPIIIIDKFLWALYPNNKAYTLAGIANIKIK